MINIRKAREKRIGQSRLYLFRLSQMPARVRVMIYSAGLSNVILDLVVMVGIAPFFIILLSLNSKLGKIEMNVITRLMGFILAMVMIGAGLKDMFSIHSKSSSLTCGSCFLLFSARIETLLHFRKNQLSGSPSHSN